MKKQGTKLSKADFAAFKAECERMIRLLGLGDWKVLYTFGPVDGGLGGCDADVEGRVARILLNPFQENCAKAEVDVRRTARHEVIHLLLSEMRWLISRRVYTDDQRDAIEHAVVRRLEVALSNATSTRSANK